MPTSNENIWSFFPSIRCINLVSRDDRYQESKEVFSDLEMNVKYHRVERNKHPEAGCFQSHIDIINEALDGGQDYILILEDDAISTVDDKQSWMSMFFSTSRDRWFGLLEEAINFMKINDNWELFYLGMMPDTSRYKVNRVSLDGNIYNVHSLCTHAYVIHRRLMEKIKNYDYAGVPIDFIYNHNKHAYAIYPSLFQQRSSVSDISPDLLSSNIGSKNWGMVALEQLLVTVNLNHKEILIILTIMIILLVLLLIFNGNRPWASLIIVILIGLIALVMLR